MSNEPTEFTLRELTYVGEDYPELIKVIRSRTSNGFAAIKIFVGTETITIANDNELFSDNYEMIALDLSRILDNAAIHSCVLPKENINE